MLVFESLMLWHTQSMPHARWLFFMVPHKLNEKTWCHPNTCPWSFVMLGRAETKKPDHKWLKNDSKMKQVRVLPTFLKAYLHFSIDSQSGRCFDGSHGATSWENTSSLCRTFLSLHLVLSSWRKDLQRFSDHVLCPSLVGTTSVSRPTWYLVSALPSTFQCFLLESHQSLSAACSHAVSVSFIIFPLLWCSCKPSSCYLKWHKKWLVFFFFGF